MVSIAVCIAVELLKTIIITPSSSVIENTSDKHTHLAESMLSFSIALTTTNIEFCVYFSFT